ncbi:MAG: hypothetical protein R3B93_12290 [Bacteroidia bacterium]
MSEFPVFLRIGLKWGITLTFFFALLSFSFSQNNHLSFVDSVNTYQQMGDSLLEKGEFTQSIFCLTQAGNFAKEGKLWPELGFSQIGIAVNYWYSRQYTKLDSILNEIHQLAQKHLPPDHEIYAYLYNLSSQRYYFQGDLEKSLAVAHKDINWELRQNEVDSANLATSYNNIESFT